VDRVDRVDRVEVEPLLSLALSDPRRALTLAQTVLENRPDPRASSIAHQAAGIVLRDGGQLAAALKELRAALRMARKAGPVERVVDVSATYGAALVMSGRTTEGLAQLDRALSQAHGDLLARVRLRRAHVLSLLGRHNEALDELRIALRTVRRSGDLQWEAHIVHNRCLVYLALGAVEKADKDAVEAERLYVLLGHQWPAAQAVHNRGLAALRRGDLPAALRFFDVAGARYASLGGMEPDLIIDRARAFLVAGMANEAAAMAEDYLNSEPKIKPVTRAELLLLAATAALAAGHIETARQRSLSARRLFRSQHRDLWDARATLVTLQAHYVSGRHTSELQASLSGLAGQLRALRCEDAPDAYLLAGRVALERGSPAAAKILSDAARYRLRGPALERASGWLAAALEAENEGRSRRVLAACGQGLDALDEHRLVFGGTELRALATGHGRELSTLALRHALAAGTARDLLVWAERWRATTLTAAWARPPDDAELRRDLAALRDATRRTEQTSSTGLPSNAADRERDRWESAVRERWMKVSGHGAGRTTPFDVEALLARLSTSGHFDGANGANRREGAQAVVLVEIDGELYALTVSRRGIQTCDVGPVDVALREAGFARSFLRRAAYGLPVPNLLQVGEQLQRSLLGSACRFLEGGPVILVPPARLHGAPWGMMPALARARLSVSPSLAIWVKAVSRPRPPVRRVVLVMGPGLPGAEAEVNALRSVHRNVSALEGGGATAERALASLEGTWLAHIVAHGYFRSDSPLFSSLTLDDGPLTVHDLDRLKRPPHRMILSACEVGGGEAVGSDEILGLVTSLLAMGTAGVMASVVPVNDEAAVGVMVRVHTELAGGRDLGEAWLAAREEASGDPLAAATAASFTAWGA
jgi:tetratricopeptide (TPR) repeat protein